MRSRFSGEMLTSSASAGSERRFGVSRIGSGEQHAAILVVALDEKKINECTGDRCISRGSLRDGKDVGVHPDE